MTWDRTKILPKAPVPDGTTESPPLMVTPATTYTPLAQTPGSVPPWPLPGEEGLAPEVREAMQAQGLVLDDEWDAWARLVTRGGER